MQESTSSIEELQKLLKDEKERCSLHRQNYQEIKDEYNKLEGELSRIYEQLKQTRTRNELMVKSHQSDVRILENKIQEQNQEIRSLVEKIQLFDSNKIKIRDAVLEEAKNHYESKIKELNADVDSLRDRYNNLRYDNAILKSKFDSQKTDFTRSLEKIEVEHLVEIEQLQSKIKSLEKEKTLPSDSYAVEFKSAKREILELNQKIKVFLSECDDLRAQNENLTLQISSLTRSNSKQAADHINNLRTLESEKMKAIRQLEVSEKELSNSQEHRKVLNAEVQNNRQEILLLQTRIEENEHNSKMILANLQAEIVQLKSIHDSEREHLMDEVTRLQSEIKNLDETLSQERQVMFVKEQDLKKDLLSARQQYWKLSNEIQQEREMFERRIKKLENGKDNVIERLSQEVQALQQKLHECHVSKSELQKEIISIRGRTGEQMNVSNTGTGVLPLETLQFQREIQELKDKFQSFAANLTKQDKTKEVVNHSANLRSSHMDKENEVLQMKLTWEQQKLRFQQRLDELESQLRECRNTSDAEKRELEFKLKQYSSQVSKLKEKVDSQKEKLYSQKDVIEKSVPAEVHFQVRNQLADLQKRLDDYKKIITAEPGFLFKQSSSSQALPSRTLADIKNIDFKSFSQQAVSCSKEPRLPSELKESAKKRTGISRRRPSKTKERNSISKTISPVISSSSDIDLENL